MSADETPQTITEGTSAAPPDEASSPPTPALKPNETAAAESGGSNDYSGLIGGLVWLVILGGLAWYWFKPGEQAKIFLQAASEPALKG